MTYKKGDKVTFGKFDHPQPGYKLSQAIDLMIPGWERSRLIELAHSF